MAGFPRPFFCLKISMLARREYATLSSVARRVLLSVPKIRINPKNYHRMGTFRIPICGRDDCRPRFRPRPRTQWPDGGIYGLQPNCTCIDRTISRYSRCTRGLSYAGFLRELNKRLFGNTDFSFLRFSRGKCRSSCVGDGGTSYSLAQDESYPPIDRQEAPTSPVKNGGRRKCILMAI